MKKKYIAPVTTCVALNAQPFMDTLSNHSTYIGKGTIDGRDVGGSDAFARPQFLDLQPWKGATMNDEW